ncbi:GNAT family N-acetyltransferase [Hymenobacter sp. 15J16-1T3B]|uniref:GNAT family N-acetyltransferase n=1 Tax=Hymenobacter sp. 15J16-1T3B TaxID=2886941 RepID=UPI001D1111DE|nr:GNAT family N-acetyltransferase [Hymenobacter sp. 15J16-1T3B]MCC3159992.1 GNAT family N-acetyltransferase [Hymenobacter sp. 15J16-1T3B]
MPLRYLTHSLIDRGAWDECVAAAAQVVPYAQAGWLEHTNAGGFDAVVETDPVTGRYLSLLPVPTQRRLWGREALQPPFTQQLGLLTTAGSRHREAGEYLGLLKGRFARLHLQLNDGNPAPAVLPAGWQAAERLTYQLPLDQSYESLHAGYCADYRRRLRQQREKAGVLLTDAADLAPLISLFQREKGGEVGGMQPAYYRRLQHLYDSLQSQGQPLLVHAHATGTAELLAGALFIRYRNRLVYLFAGATPAGKKAAAPLLLLDEAIRRHAGTPGLVLDFEGGMIPSIARFFANFGARPVPYYSLTQTTRPWYLTWMR